MSRTIQIPGGTAELFDRDELTPRRTIPYQTLLYRADDLITKLAQARKVTAPDGRVEENPGLSGNDYRLSPHEAETLEYLQLANNWGWLKSWTIDIPFPTTWEDLLDVPKHIVDALHEGVQNRGSAALDVVADFEISKETLEDKGSFTGEPGNSKTRSGGNAKRRTSTRKTSNT